MGKTSFSERIMIFASFLDDLLTTHRGDAPDVLEKLGGIHSSSKDYPLSHVIIFDDCFKGTLKKYHLQGQVLLGAMHPKQNPYDTDTHSSVIKECIDLASSKPWEVVLFTGIEDHETFGNNPHLKNVGVQESIKILSGKKALEKINEIFAERKSDSPK